MADWKPTETCTAGKVVWLLSKGHFPYLGHAGWSNDDGGREFFDEGGHAVFPIAWMEKGDWTEGEMPPFFAPPPAPWQPIKTCPANRYVWLVNDSPKDPKLSNEFIFPYRGKKVPRSDFPPRFFADNNVLAFPNPTLWMPIEPPPAPWVVPVPRSGNDQWSKEELQPRKKAGLPLLSTEEVDYPPYLRFEIAGVQQDIKHIQEQIKHILEILDLQSKRLDRADLHLSPYSQK